MSRFRLTREALSDIRAISAHISQDSPEAADRVLQDFYDAFAMLARSPGTGHSREDLTRQPALFWPVAPYLVIYHRDLRPIHIVGVLHGKRDVRRLLTKRRLPGGR